MKALMLAADHCLILLDMFKNQKIYFQPITVIDYLFLLFSYLCMFTGAYVSDC